MRNHVRSPLVALALLIILALSSGAQTCTVNWNDVHQRIDGFGASSAFSGRTWAGYTANIFFSTSNNVIYFDKSGNAYTNNGLGLSLLRNQIQPGGVVDASELSLMKLVQPLGARIWSAPWSPQASFTSNNTTIGSWFAATNSKAYAAQLANYVVSNQIVNGINIYAVSVQNEPDANVSYTSCHWTPQEIHDFATNLYNAFQASNVVSTLVMLPEDESWQTNLYLATMSDPNAAADVGIIANHNYVADNVDGDQNPPAALPSYGKPLWETEVATLSSGSVTNYFDPSITNAMYWATRIHLFMTVAQASAWHYWYLITGTTPSDNEGLMGTGDIPSKRMFALGQFSRFIRPNYYRIGTTNDNAGIMISAYKDSVSPAFAIVAINTNAGTDVSETFQLTNFIASAVTPWMTTSNLSLESQAPVPVSGASFTYTLPAMSVVTFVGQGVANTVPVWRPVSNQTINAGMTLLITNVVTDTDSPPPALVFNVLSAPTNATFTTIPANIVIINFSWRPLVSQANTTNLVSMVETEEGTPILSATNNFTVTVNPLTNPVVGSVTVSGGHVNLVVSGPQGPDYTLETTTNLTAAWQALYTTNSPVTPVSLVATNFNNPVRFYRIEIGP